MQNSLLSMILSVFLLACNANANGDCQPGSSTVDAHLASHVSLSVSAGTSNTMLWANGHQSYFQAPAGHAFYVTTAMLTNNSSGPLTTAFNRFTLKTTAGALIQATLPNDNSRYELMPMPCAATLAVAPGSQVSCQLSFEILQGAQLSSITFDDGAGNSANATP